MDFMILRTNFLYDSINDLPLLMEVEKPIAVNPDNQLRNCLK